MATSTVESDFSGFFKSFQAAANEHIEKQLKDISLAEAESNSTKNQKSQEEIILINKSKEEKNFFKTEKAHLEKELKKTLSRIEVLSQKCSNFDEKLDAAHEELMLCLKENEKFLTPKTFIDQFASLIECLDNLSFQSMNNQLVELRKLVNELEEEQNQLTNSINVRESQIKMLEKSLESSFSVTYKERNVLRVSLLLQVNKVRQEYKKCRLMEESLKAKLST